jgi:hypothetical protein
MDGPARELRRAVDRLVALGPARLARVDADGTSAHDRVQGWLQGLADLAAAGAGPAVPRLAPHAVPDQVVVLARAALESPELSDEVTRRLVDLRRAL